MGFRIRILEQIRNFDGPFYSHIYFTSKSLPKSYQLQPFASVLRCTCCWIYVTVYLLEMYYSRAGLSWPWEIYMDVKPSACLCCLSFIILLKRNLPFLNVINCNHLVLCYGYLWLDLCYGVHVGDIISFVVCSCIICILLLFADKIICAWANNKRIGVHTRRRKYPNMCMPLFNVALWFESRGGIRTDVLIFFFF